MDLDMFVCGVVDMNSQERLLLSFIYGTRSG